MSSNIIAIDTNVIIRLIQDGQFHIIGQIPDVIFVAPDEVINEVTYPSQREIVNDAITSGRLTPVTITEPAELLLFIEVSKRVESGEAACLAISQHRGYSVLSDEKRRFEREAISRLGKNRLLRTENILLLAQKHNLL